MSRILIENGVLLGAAAEMSPGYVAVENDRIAAVGTGPAPKEWRAGRRVIDARHMAVVHGLTNSHTHLEQTFMRGLADDRPLLRWLQEVIWPLQAAMTPEDHYLAATLGLVENLRCGATTVVHHHKLPSREHVEAACRAACDVGLHMVLARGWADVGSSGEPVDAILREMAWLHDTWHSTSLPGRALDAGVAGGALEGDGAGDKCPSEARRSKQSRRRVRIAFGPLAPWRCSDDAMRETVRLARAWGVPTHIHVAETQDEIDLMLRRCGKRHIEWLADLGCLGPDVQLVHCVHVHDHELDLISHAGSLVVHCPTSNMYLASGAAPLREMLARGIPVALGTDGSGSNNSQDLLECAKVAALLAKHTAHDAQGIRPADVMCMLMGGRRTSACGDLAPGATADITLVDLNNVRCQPAHSAASALVYCASGADVHTVIVGGDILLNAGRVTVLDEVALLERCRDAARRLLHRAGIGL